MSMEWEDCAGHHEIEDQADLFRTARLSHDVVETGGMAAGRLPPAQPHVVAATWRVLTANLPISRDRTRLLCADPSTMIAVSYGGDGPCPNARPDC